MTAPDLQERLEHKPVVVNVGVRSFSDHLASEGYEVVTVDWAPPAGGDPELADLLDTML